MTFSGRASLIQQPLNILFKPCTVGSSQATTVQGKCLHKRKQVKARPHWKPYGQDNFSENGHQEREREIAQLLRKRTLRWKHHQMKKGQVNRRKPNGHTQALGCRKLCTKIFAEARPASLDNCGGMRVVTFVDAGATKCVCNIWIDVKILCSVASNHLIPFEQGACGHHANACQRSYAWWWKPGLITLVYLQFRHSSFDRHGTGLSQEPQQQNFGFTRLSQSESILEVFMSHRQHFIAEHYYCSTLADFVADDNNFGFQRFILFYSILCDVDSEHGDLESFRRTSIIRRMHRWFICFLSNLHVAGFSSCWIIYWSILV